MLNSFPPVESPDSRVLILGTMPGAESLRKQEYYAFQHNVFWPIMSELLAFDVGLSYRERCDQLKAANIALWDVLKSCRRKGSLDSEIRDETPNDFATFFRKHPEIETVFFNGGGAERLFQKHVLSTMPEEAQSLAFHRLPSTSPANARLRFEEKLKQWEIINKILGQ